MLYILWVTNAVLVVVLICLFVVMRSAKASKSEPVDTSPIGQQPKGKTKFIESVSDQEKFNNATSVGDLLDGE